MTEPAPTPPAPGATPPADPPNDKPLGEAGQRALAAEREARKALEKQLADQAKVLEGLAPLGELAKVLGVKPEQGRTDVETLTQRLAAMEDRTTSAELKAMRLEVAAEKGFTPDQAAELKGSSRDELLAHADRLKALFPSTATPGIPAPDASQGARGSGGTVEALQARIAAEKDPKERVRLKARLSAAQQQRT